jgi:hypothetical protein
MTFDDLLAVGGVDSFLTEASLVLGTTAFFGALTVAVFTGALEEHFLFVQCPPITSEPHVQNSTNYITPLLVLPVYHMFHGLREYFLQRNKKHAHG